MRRGSPDEREAAGLHDHDPRDPIAAHLKALAPGRWQRLWYWPGDWLTAHSTSRDRLAVACWISIFWLTLGFGLWIWLRDALWFVGFMSIAALQLTGLTMVGTETPSTGEDDT